MPIAVQGTRYMSSGLYTHTCQSERERQINEREKKNGKKCKNLFGNSFSGHVEHDL